MSSAHTDTADTDTHNADTDTDTAADNDEKAVTFGSRHCPLRGPTAVDEF